MNLLSGLFRPEVHKITLQPTIHLPGGAEHISSATVIRMVKNKSNTQNGTIPNTQVVASTPVVSSRLTEGKWLGASSQSAEVLFLDVSMECHDPQTGV